MHFSHLQYYNSVYFHSVSMALLFVHCFCPLKLLSIYLLSILFLSFYLCLSPQRTSAMHSWVQFTSAFLLMIVILISKHSLELLTGSLYITSCNNTHKRHFAFVFSLERPYVSIYIVISIPTLIAYQRKS